MPGCTIVGSQNSWGRPPGLRGSSRTRSSPASRPAWTPAAGLESRPTITLNRRNEMPRCHRNPFILAFLILAVQQLITAQTAAPKYRDPKLTIDERVADLLGQIGRASCR